MHRRIHLLPAARQDLQGAFDWYESQEVGLGDRFLESVEIAFQAICERPLGFPIRFGAYRRIQLKTFPYTVYFKIRDEVVYVNFVIHTSQNPAKLRSRLGTNPL